MRYLRTILIINFLAVGICPLQSQVQLPGCLEQGKKEYASHNYKQAENIFLRCLKMDPSNAETLLSLGGVALTQDDLEGAKDYFLEALKNMKRTSPYLSYTYSMLGDIALKQQQNKAALAYYNHSLRSNKANVNSLVGKGVIIEKQGDPKAAAEIYKTALAVEPLNIVARKRLIALEPIYFTDEEILEALKQRYAVLPDKEKISDIDRELFQKIHAAEQNGGVEYLKGKLNPLPEEYVATLFKGTDFSREVLTVSGYNAMQKYIGQDAVAVFQKAGVPVKDIFDLRNRKGEKVFLQDSTLSDSGFVVYNDALQGRKSFLLPSEDLPPTHEELEEIATLLEKLTKSGYTEITAKEFSFIKKQTDCSEETLRRYAGLYILPVTKAERRYFVFSRSAADKRKEFSWYYTALSRRRADPSIQIPQNEVVQAHKMWGEKVCSSYDGKLMD